PLTITIQSLGALPKPGTAPVRRVLDYAESISHSTPGQSNASATSAAPSRIPSTTKPAGLHLLYCPSYDQESTPALVASGCQIVCFTTGRGTGIGNAIAPVLKIGSNSRLYARMGPDIDLNAGTILDGTRTTEEVGREIFDAIL